MGGHYYLTVTGLSGVWAVLCSVKERRKEKEEILVGVCVMEVYDFGVVEVPVQYRCGCRILQHRTLGYGRPACQIHFSGEIRNNKN